MIALLVAASLSVGQFPEVQPPPLVWVEAPGVSVQVLRPGRYYPVPMVIQPAPAGPEAPSQLILRRRYYWTPIRDLLFGRWRIDLSPTPAPMQEPRKWDSGPR
uniref:Uncharacterized protein n=1 Tax=viral metagenome TaxID=1070528 RepID=A0A6M3IE60_9ZZZZ